MSIIKILKKPMTILSIILLYFILTSFWGFYTAIKPPKIISHITPKTLGLDYEDITFTTKDNLALSGWFIPHQSKPGAGQIPAQQEKAKTIILLHGYPADKGDILPAMAFLNKTYNLLLFDFRYLGRSEGKHSSFGAKETEDLLGAIQFLKARGITEIGIWGFSVGGAVALMTASEAPEIKTIVSESSYARLDLLSSQLYRIPLLRYPLGILTNLWARVILGINPADVSPAKSAQNLTIPILIIHSKNDDVIPFEHAKLLQESLKNNPEAEFWFGENLVHGQFGQAYQSRISEFFEKNL